MPSLPLDPALLDALADPMLAVDHAWRITAVNVPALRWVDRAREAVAGRGLWEAIPELCGTPLETHARRAMREVTPLAWEVPDDGRGRSLRVRATPFAGGLVITVQDVTDWRRTEENLRESERRYRTVLEQASDGIVVLDMTDGRFIAVNDRFVEMLGYTREELLRMTAPEVMDAGDLEGAAERIVQLSAGRTLLSERTLRRKDGRWIPVEVSSRRSGDALMSVVRDIGERRELEQQLRQAQKMEAVGQLAGGIAHDFNNLLTIINTYGEIVLADLPEGDPRRDDVQEIRRAGQRAAELTRQLLAFSRKQLLDPRPVDLNAIVEEMEPMLRRLIGADVKVITRLCPQLWPVLADPGQLEQVIMNLVVNARDAMPEGGTLTIETTNETIGEHGGPHRTPVVAGDYARLVVRDTGHGMDAATRERIFEPFFTTKEPGRGTGLGLSTAYGIVRQSGGYIWCDSEPGGGCEFTIALPRLEEATRALPPRAEPHAAMPAGRGSGTVLVVEDEDAVRRLTRRILEEEGYTVLEACNGSEALRAAQERTSLDLVVTDVVMPEMSGRMLAARLAAVRPGLRVLYVSGYTGDDITRRGLDEPGIDLLQKPFAAAQLVQRVREVMAARG
jgi:PAS domain S-box-containing protein